MAKVECKQVAKNKSLKINEKRVIAKTRKGKPAS